MALLSIILVIAFLLICAFNPRYAGGFSLFAFAGWLLWLFDLGWFVNGAVLLFEIGMFVFCLTERPNPLEELLTRVERDGIPANRLQLLEVLNEATHASDRGIKRFTRLNKEYAARLRREEGALQMRAKKRPRNP